MAPRVSANRCVPPTTDVQKNSEQNAQVIVRNRAVRRFSPSWSRRPHMSHTPPAPATADVRLVSKVWPKIATKGRTATVAVGGNGTNHRPR